MTRGFVQILALSICLIALWGPPANAGPYLYSVEEMGRRSSDLREFASVAAATLDDIRGWSLHLELDFRAVQKRADFRLILASPAQVGAASSSCDRCWSCRIGDRVLINQRRWRRSSPSWPRSLRSYRKYIINHEVGHWLGLGHSSCPGKGSTAPVMMQQSIDLGACRARVWPTHSERSAVALLHGVAGWRRLPHRPPPREPRPTTDHVLRSFPRT
jgi:Protein of unknown function (DUF3152)